jgi:hypothetical protein
MQGAHAEFGIFLIHHHGDLDLGGRDHPDVDAFAGQGPEHSAGNPGMRAHADTDDRDLDDLLLAANPARAHAGGDAVQDRDRCDAP